MGSINIDDEALVALRIAVVKKYGKIYGHLNDEASQAALDRAAAIEAELDNPQ